MARSDCKVRRKIRSASPIALFLALGILSACTTADVLVPVPQDQVGYATIDPFKEIRFWADDRPEVYAELEKKRVEKIRAAYGDTLRGRAVPINYLCISGGGSSGAFGAGFLVGWTAKGTRPQFGGVTGISTGSMIAPLAFLGPNTTTSSRRPTRRSAPRTSRRPRCCRRCWDGQAAWPTRPR